MDSYREFIKVEYPTYTAFFRWTLRGFLYDEENLSDQIHVVWEDNTLQFRNGPPPAKKKESGVQITFRTYTWITQKDIPPEVIYDIMCVCGEGFVPSKSPLRYCLQIKDFLEYLGEDIHHLARIRIEYLDIYSALKIVPYDEGPIWYLQHGDEIGISTGEFRTAFLLNRSTNQIFTVGSFNRYSLSARDRLFRGSILAKSKIDDAVCPRIELIENNQVLFYRESKKKRLYLEGKASGFRDSESIRFYFSAPKATAHKFRIDYLK